MRSIVRARNSVLSGLQGFSIDETSRRRIVECEGNKMLELLHKCSGSFRPGILTALVGSSGAGKTTLMDCLAGRKTSASADSAARLQFSASGHNASGGSSNALLYTGHHAL